MGRIRTIKPEFFLHEGLYDLEHETGLPIRLAFAGLWTQSDREGRFKWSPRKLKTQILPYDSIDFSRVLDALATRGFIVHYSVLREEFGWIPSFLIHQVINNRERDSDLPSCDENAEILNGLTCDSRVNDACPTPLNLAQEEGKGREGKGRSNGRFTPPTIEEVEEYCKERNKGVDPERFINFYAMKGWMVGKNKMKDWKAAVRTWEGNGKDHGFPMPKNDGPIYKPAPDLRAK